MKYRLGFCTVIFVTKLYGNFIISYLVLDILKKCFKNLSIFPGAVFQPLIFITFSVAVHIIKILFFKKKIILVSGIQHIG